MKKLFFAALIALAGFTACGTKNVETAATEATEQREVGGGDIAYVQVEAVLAQSDLYNAEGIALKDKTEKAQKSWAQKEQNFQYEVAQLQEKYQKGLITTNDAQSTQENIERRIASYQAAAQKEAKALDEENFVFSNRAQDCCTAPSRTSMPMVVTNSSSMPMPCSTPIRRSTSRPPYFRR